MLPQPAFFEQHEIRRVYALESRTGRRLISPDNALPPARKTKKLLRPKPASEPEEGEPN